MTTGGPNTAPIGPVSLDDLMKFQQQTINQFTGGAKEGYTIQQTYNEIFGLSGAEAEGKVLFDKGRPGGYVPGGSNVPNIPRKVSTFREAMQSIHNMDEVQLGRMQQRMWEAGFYPPSAYKKGGGPNTGTPDANTVQAFRTLFTTSVMYQGKKTVDEILDDFKNTGGFYSDEERAAAARGFGGGVEVITTSDPATLRQMSTRVAQAILGRAVDDHERDAIVAQILQQEKAPQQQQVAAGVASEQAVAGAGAGTYVAPTVLEQTRVDAEARIAEEIERRNPEEAAGMAGAGMYEALIEMIRAGSG